MACLIRELRVDDLARAADLGERLIDATPQAGLFPPGADRRARVEAIVRLALERGVLLGADVDGTLVGGLGLVVVPHLLSGRPMALEVAWWVDPAQRTRGLGPKLLAAAEAWSCTRGISMLQMFAPQGSAFGRYFARRGYAPLETPWMRTWDMPPSPGSD
jgi:GNAT superfamily N-acetyltransferase